MTLNFDLIFCQGNVEILRLLKETVANVGFGLAGIGLESSLSFDYVLELVIFIINGNQFRPEIYSRHDHEDAQAKFDRTHRALPASAAHAKNPISVPAAKL